MAHATLDTAGSNIWSEGSGGYETRHQFIHLLASIISKIGRMNICLPKDFNLV
jgi:hypothetical protein